MTLPKSKAFAGNLLVILLAWLFTATTAFASDIKWTSLPRDASVKSGNSVTFAANAKGSGTIKYEWRKNGKAIKGANGKSLTLRNVRTADAGRYSVVASNRTGRNFSKVAVLKVAGGTGNKAASTAPRGALNGTGKATLAWKQPVKRTNGSKIGFSEINAYRVYHTDGSGKINRVYKVSKNQRQHTVAKLPKGTHHFVITTVDTSGLESPFTRTLKKTIR